MVWRGRDQLKLPHLAETFVLLTRELWAIVWHNYIRDAIMSKLHFNLADDMGEHGGVEMFDFPKPRIQCSSQQ